MIVAGEDESLETVKRLRAHPVRRHVQLRGPQNGVENQLAEIRVPPVRVAVAAGKTEPASAVRAFDRPSDRKVIRLFRRTRDDDWPEAGIILPEAKTIIVFLPRCERIHSPQNGMPRRSRL